MIIWSAIAGVLIGAFLLRAIGHYCAGYRHHDGKRRHIVEISKAEEIFFVPGDIDEDDDFADI